MDWEWDCPPEEEWHEVPQPYWRQEEVWVWQSLPQPPPQQEPPPPPQQTAGVVAGGGSMMADIEAWVERDNGTTLGLMIAVVIVLSIALIIGRTYKYITNRQQADFY